RPATAPSLRGIEGDPPHRRDGVVCKPSAPPLIRMVASSEPGLQHRAAEPVTGEERELHIEPALAERTATELLCLLLEPLAVRRRPRQPGPTDPRGHRWGLAGSSPVPCRQGVALPESQSGARQ